MSQVQEPFLQIPKSVAFNSNLSPMARLVYGHILSLSYDKGYCWASNEYIADQIGIKTRQLQNIIKELDQVELIKIQIDWKQKNQSRRKIYPMTPKPEVQKTAPRVMQKTAPPSCNKLQDRHAINCTQIDKRIDKRIIPLLAEGKSNKLTKKEVARLVQQFASDSKTAPARSPVELTHAVKETIGSWSQAGAIRQDQWRFIQPRIYEAYAEKFREPLSDEEILRNPNRAN